MLTPMSFKIKFKYVLQNLIFYLNIILQTKDFINILRPKNKPCKKDNVEKIEKVRQKQINIYISIVKKFIRLINIFLTYYLNFILLR